MADETTTAPAGEQQTQERGRRRTAIGVVTRDKMDKTRRVEIPRMVQHARYGKYIRRRTVCYVHDENNETHIGDTVEIMECRPLSKLKHWRLVRLVTRAPGGKAPAQPATTAGGPADSGAGAPPTETGRTAT